MRARLLAVAIIVAVASAGPLQAATRVEPRSDGRLAVSDDGLMLEMRRIREGRPQLALLCDRVAKIDHVTRREGADLWRVQMLDPDREVRAFSSSEAEFSTAQVLDDGVDLRWRVPLGEAEMLVTVSMRAPGENRTEWRLSVDNRSDGWSPWWMELVIPGLGVAGETDVIEGRWRHDAPAQRLSGHFFSEQLLLLHTGGSTLYVAAEDPDHLAKSWELAVGEEFVLRMSPPGMGVAGESYQQPFPLVVRPVPGSWWRAAEVYREWASGQRWFVPSEASETEERLREVRLWLTAMHPLTQNHAEIPARALQTAEAVGVPAGIHWYNWANEPYMPDIFPANKGFYEAVADAREAGLAVMPYINVLQHVQKDDFPLRDAACQPSVPSCCGRVKDGLYDIQVGKWETTPMCRGADEWVEFCARQAARLFDEGGCRAIYLDQAASSPRWPCFNTAHDHPAANGAYWAEGTAGIPRRIKELTGGEMAVAGEGRFEGYLAHVDLDLTGYWGEEAAYVPLYEAIYGGRTASFAAMRADAPIDEFVYKIGVRALFGAGTRVSTEIAQRQDGTQKLEFLREILGAQVTLRDLLRDGRLVEPPAWAEPPPLTAIERFQPGKRAQAVTMRVPALQRSAWRSAEAQAVIVLNVSDAPVRAALDLRTPTRRPDGPWTLTDSGGAVIDRGDAAPETLRVQVPGRSVRIIRWEMTR